MDIHSIRQELKHKSIYDIPLVVTFYARVSSEKDEQLNSLGNQISYYRNFIQKNKRWNFVDGYIDEGISGISTNKRENFHRMIEDAKAGKFDLVITKEITRFARNTLDSLSYTRLLLNCGVGVFFQNDNINTLDEDSELRLTIMSSIAQDEVRKLSSRIRFGHQQAIKNNVVLGNSRIFGYKKRDKKLVIDEKEAEMVRLVFDLYSTGEYSMRQIENILWTRGYRNHNGNKISHTTLSNTISNPKYKGYYVGNKVKIMDMFSKKQKFLPPEEWIMFKDETGELVPAIVSEEVWDEANRVLKQRSLDVKQRQNKCNHANLLTGKLFCTHCGTSYYRRSSADRHGNKGSNWTCSHKIKSGADSCPSFTIHEDEIVDILYDVFKETSENTESILQEYTKMCKELSRSNSYKKNIEAIKKQIDQNKKKKSKLLELNIAGKISDEDFVEMNNQCNKEIKQSEAEILQLEEQQTSLDDFENNLKVIKKQIQSAKHDVDSKLINKHFIDTYISKIYVTPLEEDKMKLEIKIFTDQTIVKNYYNSRCRSGHMSKKMIQAYENSIK